MSDEAKYKSREWRKFSLCCHAESRISFWGYQRPGDYAGTYGRRLNAHQTRRLKHWERRFVYWYNRLRKDFPKSLPNNGLKSQRQKIQKGGVK